MNMDVMTSLFTYRMDRQEPAVGRFVICKDVSHSFTIKLYLEIHLIPQFPNSPPLIESLFPASRTTNASQNPDLSPV